VSPKSGEKRLDRTTNNVLEKVLAYALFKENLLQKPFGKYLRKPLFAGILRK
jgi:hypothetical protein